MLSAKSGKISGTPIACGLRSTTSAGCIGTLRVTPAMEAGIAGHVWDLKELLA
jgi:hypothetical protein